jgi:hypothetical protein
MQYGMARGLISRGRDQEHTVLLTFFTHRYPRMPFSLVRSALPPRVATHRNYLRSCLTSPSNGKTIVYNAAPNTSTQAQAGRAERSLRVQDLHCGSEWRLL